MPREVRAARCSNVRTSLPAFGWQRFIPSCCKALLTVGKQYHEEANLRSRMTGYTSIGVGGRICFMLRAGRPVWRRLLDRCAAFLPPLPETLPVVRAGDASPGLAPRRARRWRRCARKSPVARSPSIVSGFFEPDGVGGASREPEARIPFWGYVSQRLFWLTKSWILS